MSVVRRVILLWLFMFWQGGFLFYGAVVVTIGGDALGDFGQGLITRHVTAALNLAGLIVLLAWLWDLGAERKTRCKRRWATWCVLMLTLAALAWIHPRMDALIDSDQYRLLDRDAFRHLHRWYLRISTAQWIASMAFTVFTIQNWRATDRDLDGER